MTPPRLSAIDLPLTDSMMETYQFIRAYAAEHGWPPTFREIATARAKSLTGIAHHIARLEAAGYISRHHNRPRTLSVLK